MKIAAVFDGMNLVWFEGSFWDWETRMSVTHLVEEFSTLEDPRHRGKIGPRLIDTLVIAVCAVIAGAESWEDIALYGRSKIDGLGTCLALPHGIPAMTPFGGCSC